MTLHERIIELLRSSGVWFELLQHPPVYTSEQAAQVRQDVSLRQGAKAMILSLRHSALSAEADRSKYVMVVLTGDRFIDFKKVKKFLKAKDTTLATAAEVEAVVGVKVGAVSPFGNLSGLSVLVDRSLLDNEVIAFNAGDHRRSVKMKCPDFLSLSLARVGDFSKVN